MTLFHFLFSLPMQFVYSVDFFFPQAGTFPVTCPQLEGERSFLPLSNIVIFHFPKLFPHAIYSWWYRSSLVLFPSLKKEMWNYKPFISSAPLPSAFFCLLRGTGKLQLCPHPLLSLSVHHFQQPPAVPHFGWQNLVLHLISSGWYSLIPLIFCLQLHDLIHLCYRAGKAPALISSVMSSSSCPCFSFLFASNFKWLSAGPGQGFCWPIPFWCHAFL